MNRQSLRIVRAMFIVVAVVGVLLFTRQQPTAGSQTISLVRPAFVDAVQAADSATPNAIASVLDRDAGIAAYAQTSPFTLGSIRSLFETIENETSDYILGTISVPGNWGNFDVHFYAHKAGWLLAYYLRTQPSVTIFDWQTYIDSPANPTRFQAVFNLVTITLSRPELSLTYYDFRYPNATNVVVAAQAMSSAGAVESFEIPNTDFVYYERSWLLSAKNFDAYFSGDRVALHLDGVEIALCTSETAAQYKTGYWEATQLAANESHLVEVSVQGWRAGISEAIGAVAIVYGPQP